MSKVLYFFGCLLVVLGSRHVSGGGTGTINDPFESECTDPDTGAILFTRRWQSISDDAPIVAGDTTIGTYQIRQKEFSYLTTFDQGIPIVTAFKGQWNEHTATSWSKIDANGFLDRVKDYLRSDLATVKSFPKIVNGVRVDDRYKWVHNYVESSMQINTAWTIGHVSANAFVDDPSILDNERIDFCFYDFSFDNSGPGGGAWDMFWHCESDFDDFCGGQSGD